MKIDYKNYIIHISKCINAMPPDPSMLEACKQYKDGEVYNYSIYNSHGDDVESCCEFYGIDYTVEVAQESIDGFILNKGK
jgi:hypothetical protein